MSAFHSLLSLSLIWLHVFGTVNCLAVKGVPFPSLIDVTIDDLAEGLESGLFTSVDLVHAYLGRIGQVNSILNVVAEVNPDALSIASDLDAQRANGTIKGPLHGIPILIKNNIATADRMNNTAGSWGLLGAKVPHDSFMAKKLREAGAIILGKTNMSQWANFRSNNTSNGWSALGGQVYAAYHPQQDPSGSSSGSGVASDLGLALASLGTETDGSILSPSERNNLVGIKPTVGLTSRHLVIPISEHQDTIGPMARTVKDAAYILHAIAGMDPRDNYTSAIPNEGRVPYYPAACDIYALRGARIGIPRNAIALFSDNTTTTETNAFEEALKVFKSAGAIIVDNANFTAADKLAKSNSETIVLNADFISNLASYLATLSYNPNNLTSLADVRRFTQSYKPEDYPDRNTALWDKALDELGFNNTDPRFWDAWKESQYLGGEGGLLGTLERHQLDAVILPTGFSSTWAAIQGAPAVTVPLGFYPANATVIKNQRGDLVDKGPHVPFGIAFLGAKFTEAKLIGLAYAYEQRTLTRSKVQPYITPNIEIGDYAGY